jgi:hypothetical protein
LLADMMSNYQPTRVSVAGVKNADISGGPQLGAGGKQAMAELSRQALLAQLTPDKFEGGTVMAPPSLSKLPQAGKMDSFLNTLGPASAIAGAIGSARQSQGSPNVPRMEAASGFGSLPGQEVPLGGMPTAPAPSAATAAELDRLRKQLDPSF